MGAYLRPESFRSGDALFRALTGQNALNYLLNLQRDMVAWEIQQTEPDLPTPMDALVGGQTIKDFQGDKSELARARMPFATTLRFVAPDARGADIDFVKEARMIMIEVRGRFSIRPGKRPNDPQMPYHKAFRFMVGGSAYIQPPPNESFTIIGITNIANHASTLENPTWPQPFRKCFTQFVRRRAKAMGYEARFRYLGGSSEGYTHRGIRPDPNRKQSYPRWINYAVPIIEIGPLGSMGGKTGIWRARHGRNRRRMR
jgi:hypothetical protein